MFKLINRRQFFNQLSASLLGISTFTLFSLLSKKSFSQTIKQNLAPNPDLLIPFLQERIPQLMTKYLIPGLSIAIVKEGKLLWSEGFGVKNYQKKTPFDRNTILAAASLGKPLFAYLVMKLVEKEVLNLDVPLTNYTAKPYISDPRIEQITPRMILDHTVGFPNWSGDAPVWIENNPGSQFSYSSEGYVYLQKVIEEITQEPFSSYSQRELFLPLGMNDSSYIWEDKYEGRASDGHDRTGKAVAMGRPTEALAAGSLRTSAPDYAQFLIAMMSSSNNDPILLEESSLEKMLTPQIRLNPWLDWGLGWALESNNDQRYFWHWGDGRIFKSFTLGSRQEQTAIVILTNSQNGLKMAEEVTETALDRDYRAFNFSLIEY